MSQQDSAKAFVRYLHTVVERFKTDVGRYPRTDEGLAILADPPADEATRARWRGPYLDRKSPMDP